MSNFNDLSGKKFGRLTVVDLARRERGNFSGTRLVWNCVCECGALRTVSGNSLTTGNTRSCGCLHRDVNRARLKKHGNWSHPLYPTWQGMMARCNKPTDSKYDLYGGRGIYVDSAWHDFKVFASDVGERPEGKTLDRIDNDGPYAKWNCRWADVYTQANNKRGRRKILFNGRETTVKALSVEYGVNLHTLWTRVQKGWPIEEAVGLKERRTG